MKKYLKQLKKVLILGSGGLRIGQAGEFDYSGSQAIKALKEEGIASVLINPNIATVQTDPGVADEIYFLPLEVESVVKVIEKERPDGIFFSFGGQTALNLGLELEEQGVLTQYGLQTLGTSVETIRITEDRNLFKRSLAEVDIKTAISKAVRTVDDALEAAEQIGFPVMVRSGFSLGGLGSGRVNSPEELCRLAAQSLRGSPQILIEEYLEGWKEIEYEIVRDEEGNGITVCNMENFDPMGVHTGESIVVAPSQTLSDRDYQLLRTVALRAADHFKIIGECNIQYALNPQTGDYRVIEMNARLSRSSALASKATGYPLAFIAAKLALGYPLYALKNGVTGKTSAFFEPALDYIVVKMPRWDIKKLKSADHKIGSEMKSVGEVMAIGRDFGEALQKAVRMLNIGAEGLGTHSFFIQNEEEEIRNPTDRRLFALYSFFRKGGTVEAAYSLSKIDWWFLHKLKEISDFEPELEKCLQHTETLLKAKQFGFSDGEIAAANGTSWKEVRAFRKQKNILPSIKQIDTLAGEFDAETNYLYTTYFGTTSDVVREKNAILVLGSGPYCIGSSVEFDWSGVNMVKALRQMGKNCLVLNCNPETVSTDYDESERLYFEELSLERVLDIYDREQPEGVVVSVGGQIANNLALALDQEGVPILGTSPQNIDRAENRKVFSTLLNDLGIDQPRWISACDTDEAAAFAEKVGYPVLVRPSYVLSGAAMNIAHKEKELLNFLKEAVVVSPKYPVVISEFISGAKELEVDGVADGGIVVIDVISEHVENAGVHSGDATIVVPPQRLYLETIRRTKKITRSIVQALQISGPFNIQFIAKDNEIKVIECNVRAARSFPFVSKVTGYNFIEIAARVLMGQDIDRAYETLDLDYVGVKSPQFSYQRLKGANPVAHVEMASTGEVACIADDYQEAFFLSWLAVGQACKGKRLLVSIGGDQKSKLFPMLKALEKKGWELFATPGTHDYLTKKGVSAVCLFKISDRYEPNILTAIREKKVDLILNIPKEAVGKIGSDGYKIRRHAVDFHIPLVTNISIAQLLLKCLLETDLGAIAPKSLNDFNLQNKQYKEGKIELCPLSP